MSRLDEVGTWMLITKEDKELIRKLLIKNGNPDPTDSDVKQFVINAVALTNVDYYRLIELVKRFVGS